MALEIQIAIDGEDGGDIARNAGNAPIEMEQSR
jgi:hypothetical protein